jgi:hypothetical protein
MNLLFDKYGRPMTQGELLRHVGDLLYGKGSWSSRMAGDLDVNRRTIQRWLDATEIMPIGVWLDLDRLLGERIAAATTARSEIAPFSHRGAPRSAQ